MTMKPRVHARHETDANEFGNMSGIVHTTPAVEIHLEFDLHDHEAALRHLDIAVANVRSQIEETRRAPATPGERTEF